MATMQPTTPPVTTPPRRWPLFLLGVFLFILGPALYMIEFNMGRLVTPWEVPILSSIGVLFMLVSVWQRRGVLRIIGLVLGLLICGVQWYVIAVATRTPPYTGPAQAGKEFPPFEAKLVAAKPAESKTFTNKDLEKDKPTLLVFFRGHW